MHTQQAERFMSNTLARLRIDERGIETLEWLAVAVLILIVAFAIYPGTLQAGLTTVINNITSALTSAVPTGS
jgi:Flp pilus assembly pilin Flp